MDVRRIMAWYSGRQQRVRQMLHATARRVAYQAILLVFLLVGVLGQFAAAGIGIGAEALAKGQPVSHTPNTLTRSNSARDAWGSQRGQHAPANAPAPKGVGTGWAPAVAPSSAGRPAVRPLAMTLSSDDLTGIPGVASRRVGRDVAPNELHWETSPDGLVDLGVPAHALDFAAATVAGRPITAPGQPAATAAVYTLQLTQTQGAFRADASQLARFTLNVVNESGAQVSSVVLRAPLQLKLHYGAHELDTVNPASLRLVWPNTGNSAKHIAAASVPLSVNTASHTLSARISAPSALSAGPMAVVDNPADAAPAATVHLTNNANQGDLSFTYPLDLPPAAGGLLPPLQLVYSSGGPNGRTNEFAPAPWVGDGFDLSLGSITYDPNLSMYLLNGVGGFSTPLLCCMTDAYGNNWFAPHHDPQVRVRVQDNSTDPSTSGKCFSVYTPDGLLYQLGCDTANGSLRWRYRNGSRLYYEWDVNSVQRVNASSQGALQRYAVKYWVDGPTDPSTGQTYVRDAAMDELDYNFVNGSPQVRVLFNVHWPQANMTLAAGQTATAYGTNYNCSVGTPVATTTLRCDDSMTPPNYLPGPLTMSTISLDNLLIQVNNGAPGSSNWQAVRKYNFTYEDNPYGTSWINGSQTANAGEHTLTSIQETPFQNGAPQPSLQPMTLNYIWRSKNEYHDTTQLDSSGTIYDVQTWWRYPNAIKNLQTGASWSIAWVEGYGNTHGVSTGSVTDPTTCNTANACTGANAWPDDRQWPRHLLASITDTGVTPNLTTSYTYRLNTPCGTGCTQDTWIPPNGWNACNNAVQPPANPNQGCLGGTYQNYYNEEFTGFSQVTTTHPDGSTTVAQYWAGEGWGSNDWFPGNMHRGKPTIVDTYQGAPGGNPLVEVWHTYTDGNHYCPVTAPSSNLYRYPYEFCESMELQRDTYYGGMSGTSPAVPHLTQTWSYTNIPAAGTPPPLMSTGFELGQLGPTWADTVDTGPGAGGNLVNVTGFCCGLTHPETGSRGEITHTGSYALMYSGYDTSTSISYAYTKVFDLSPWNLAVSPDTTLSYWIYPQSHTSAASVSGNNSTCVAIDMIFSDGSSLRDSGATDQNGVALHPAAQCNHLQLDTWNHVTSAIGRAVAGKIINRIDVGYDQAPNIGGYRGYIDDITIGQSSERNRFLPQLDHTTTTANDLQGDSFTSYPAQPTFTTTYTYAWHDGVLDRTNTYLPALPAQVVTDDNLGNRWACMQTSYDGLGYLTGQQTSITNGLATRVDRYADCGNAGNNYTMSGDVVTGTGYDGYGNPIVTMDADTIAANTYTIGCSAPVTPLVVFPSTAGAKFTTCTRYDDTQQAYVTSVNNAYFRSSAAAWDIVQGYQTQATDANSVNTTFGAPVYEYAGGTQDLAHFTDTYSQMTAPGEAYGGSSPWTRRTYSYSFCATDTSATRPCTETDTVSQLDGTHLQVTRTFYDRDGRAVETRTTSPTSGNDLVTFTIYNDVNDTTFASQPCAVPALTTSNGGTASASTAGYVAPAKQSDGSDGAYIDPASACAGTTGTTTYADALGRTLATDDALGTGVGASGTGCLVGSAHHTTCAAYDVAVASSTPGLPSGDGESYQRTTTIDADLHQAATYTDALGRVAYTQAFTGTSQTALGSGVSTYAVLSTLYDPLGTARVVKNAGGNATTLTYNRLGRLTSGTDPDSGTWTYAYDPNGNLTQQVDARGAAGTVYLHYDALNRVQWQSTSANGSNPFATWTYDGTANSNVGVGRLTGETFASGPSQGVTGSYAYTYDQRSQATITSMTLTGPSTPQATYTLTATYDDANRVVTTSLPAAGDLPAETLTSAYNDTQGGILASLSSSVSDPTSTLFTAPTYTSQGLLSGWTSGADTQSPATNVALALTYDGDLRPTSKTFSFTVAGATTPTALARSQPTYDAAGNVATLTTTLAGSTGGDNAGGSETQAFCYDDLNRLTWASTQSIGPCGRSGAESIAGAGYTASYSYDALDRVTNASVLDASGNQVSTAAQGAYTYNTGNATGHLHAVAGVGGNAWYTAAYDTAGHLTCRAVLRSGCANTPTPTGQTLTYDALGRLLSWQDDPAHSPAQASYAYDGEGRRVWMRGTTSDGSGTYADTWVYILGTEDLHIQAYGTQSPYTAGIRYYPLPGGVTAERDVTGLQYVTTDALGTPILTYSLTTGAVLGTQLRTPYGQPRLSSRAGSNGGMHTTLGFTGQREDTSAVGVGASGLDYFNARYYDSVVGRFTAADTVRGADPLGDAYAYVSGRVENATDPSGHMYTSGADGGGDSGGSTGDDCTHLACHGGGYEGSSPSTSNNPGSGTGGTSGNSGGSTGGDCTHLACHSKGYEGGNLGGNPGDDCTHLACHGKSASNPLPTQQSAPPDTASQAARGQYYYFLAITTPERLAEGGYPPYAPNGMPWALYLSLYDWPHYLDAVGWEGVASGGSTDLVSSVIRAEASALMTAFNNTSGGTWGQRSDARGLHLALASRMFGLNDKDDPTDPSGTWKGNLTQVVATALIADPAQAVAASAVAPLSGQLDSFLTYQQQNGLTPSVWGF